MNDKFHAPVRSGRHGGVTNLANDGSKLVTSKSSIAQASVGVKTATGTFDISKLTIDATKTPKGAVENQLTFQAQTLASDFARNLNRQFFGDGYGVVGQVSGSVSSTQVSLKHVDSDVDDGRVLDRYGSINGDIPLNEYFFADQIIGVGTGGADLGTISSVDGTSITFTGNVASAANDALYIVDGDGAGAGTSEITGIAAALSSSTGTSTYAGVSRNTQAWTPQFGSTSEALTLSRMEDKYLAAKKFAQMGDTYAIFVNRTLFKRYGDILTAMRRTVNQTDLLGGWTGFEFAAGAGKVGVFLDYQVPDGECLIINLDTWTICQVSDMDWLENPSEGAMVRRPDYITFQATMHWFLNLLCVAPGANARLVQKTD